MQEFQPKQLKIKDRLHPRNRHRAPYDFERMVEAHPELKPFVKPNVRGELSIDFFSPDAVKLLNQILLRTHYGIEFWDIPANYLCPPIPGRADYIHYLADLLAGFNNGEIPTGKNFRCLDVGVGANCIYPIVGITEYGWSFTGSDIDLVSLKTAKAIAEFNPALKGKIELRLQENPLRIFEGIIRPGEIFDVTICNPPFHASEAEAASKALRKYNNLTGGQHKKAVLNFGGQHNELWCEGGEAGFLKRMAKESAGFAKQVRWFSTLVSKGGNLKAFYFQLEKAGASEMRTLTMGQGGKTSRIVVWRFEIKAESPIDK